MRLAGKRALITGGGTGIGRATAELFAREGAAVMVSGRRETELAETVRRVAAGGGRAGLVAGDVSSAVDAERMVRETVTALGGIDVLVNNAGIIVRNASVTSVSLEDWERMLRIDLTGVFLVSRFALLEMLKAGQGGSIVHVSSVAGILGDPKLAPYNAAKGGVNLLTKNMALDYAPHGIRVNAVCPGRIWTPMPISRLKPGDDPQEILARWGKNIPLGRVGTPEDVARAILFLASDESAWITGTWLVVDGGATISHPPIG
ncbi:MAG: SDR family oxidoreductase [Candidatus Rokubacteria bacterium]|nr:SDR family oxidoreductase [Candidatus Rokubacteria bacterium]